MNVIQVTNSIHIQDEEYPIRNLSTSNLLQRSLLRLKYSYSKNLTTLYDQSNFSINVENDVANSYISSRVNRTTEEICTTNDLPQRSIIIYKYEDKFLIPMMILEDGPKTMILKTVGLFNIA
jgi:hypothetical protein